VRREVAVQGWHPVEDMIQWGFTRAPVVMANEAHDGLTLDRGWSLWAYEANVFDTDAPAWGTLERVNWREREQARNLCQVVAVAPAEPLLVWCGNRHAGKEAGGQGERTLMGWHFRAMSGIDQFVIDQTVTVAFRGRDMPWAPSLLAGLGDTLTAGGGAAAILREQAPAPLKGYPGVDAVVVSADNELT
jgi:hypothetical protein